MITFDDRQEDDVEAERLKAITEQIIGAAIAVHRELGPGLLESAYEACLTFEIAARGLRVDRQRNLPIVYRTIKLDCAYRLDMVVEDVVVVEIKAVDELLPVHQAQVLSYLKLSKLPVALLINFHSAILRNGIRRIVHHYPDSLPSSASSAFSAPLR
jgi:GxxExxY protein